MVVFQVIEETAANQNATADVEAVLVEVKKKGLELAKVEGASETRREMCKLDLATSRDAKKRSRHAACLPFGQGLKISNFLQ